MQAIEWDGRPITRPGLISRVPLSAYHSAGICDGPSVSSSGLRKMFSESPAHFYAEWPGNPEWTEDRDTPHFTIGRAVHHLMLGEPFFAKLFCIQPAEYTDEKTGEMKPWNNNANVCKRWNAEQAKAGRSILKGEDVTNIKGMATSLGRHPLIRAGALNGAIERTIVWKDKDTGIWLKSRPDSIPGDSQDFIDLKSCVSVRWNYLTRAVAEYGYHMQGAMVRMAAREVLGMDNSTFTLVFVEKTNPWCARVITLKDNDLDRGERQIRSSLDTMARCLKSKVWPGPGGEGGDAEYLELPEWSQKQIDSQLDTGVY